MKTTILFIFILVTTIFSQNCFAFNDNNNKGNSKESSEKAIEKSRAQKLKQDQKYLKQAKKRFWAMQSKQVKKTIKKTERRNRIQANESGLMY